MLRSLRWRFFLIVWPLVVGAIIAVGWYFGRSTRVALHREMRVAAAFDVEDLALGDSVAHLLALDPPPEPDELLAAMLSLARAAEEAGFPEPRLALIDDSGTLAATTDPELARAVLELDGDVLHVHRTFADGGGSEANVEMRLRGEDVALPDDFRFVDGVDPARPVRLFLIPSPEMRFSDRRFDLRVGDETFADDAFGNETIDEFQVGEFLNRTNRTILTGVILASVLAALATLLLARPVVGRAGALAAAARRIREGDLTVRVPARSRDELGDVEGAFNEMAEELERSEEIKRRMVSDAAHELRTPLTNLVGTLEAIEDGLRRPDESTLASLREEVSLLERLVEDLQEIAVADAGALALDLDDVDLFAEADAAIEAFESKARARGVALHLQADGVPGRFVKADAASDTLPEPWMVRADRRRLAQIFRNLLANAITHAPADTEVRVRLARRGANIDVAVQDRGAGIPPKHLDLIWERFYRIEESRDRDSGGIGLGLAIVKRLVEAQGGRVWAESRPGEGATFHFTLPAA
ncbi:MAG: ATP-binding protein [Gemmatimonadota bacterium]|nr:ATP-binding protein [Gemmatimonadota bacterium]